MCLDERAMNAEVKNWMKEEEISFTKDLINYFMTRLLRIVKKKKKRAIVWHEAFRYGLQGFEDSVVQVWDQITPEATVHQLTSRNIDVIISFPWYLDHVKYGESWRKMFEFEPYSFGGSRKQNSHVLGGEACMWGEFFDQTNFYSALWSVSKLLSNLNIQISAKIERISEFLFE